MRQKNTAYFDTNVVVVGDGAKTVLNKKIDRKLEITWAKIACVKASVKAWVKA